MKRPKRHQVINNDDSESDSDDDNFIKVYKDTIYYRGEIKEPQATEFCIELRKLSEKQFDMHDPCVHIMLSSEGGDVFAGLTMYETLKRCKSKTIITCEGCVASAATLVLLGANERTMYQTSVILVHSLRSWMGGYAKPKEIKEELQNSETLTEICTRVYKTHCKIKKPALEKMYDTDLYMTAQQCLHYGFVDKIV